MNIDEKTKNEVKLDIYKLTSFDREDSISFFLSLTEKRAVEICMLASDVEENEFYVNPVLMSECISKHVVKTILRLRPLNDAQFNEEHEPLPYDYKTALGMLTRINSSSYGYQHARKIASLMKQCYKPEKGANMMLDNLKTFIKHIKSLNNDSLHKEIDQLPSEFISLLIHITLNDISKDFELPKEIINMLFDFDRKLQPQSEWIQEMCGLAFSTYLNSAKRQMIKYSDSFAFSQFYIEYLDTNIVHPETKISLLGYAISMDEERLALKLLANGADINMKNGFKNNAPIHEAIESKNFKSLKLLLEYKKTDVNSQNILGQTPLHLAALLDNVNMVQVLIKAGAKNDICDNLGNKAATYSNDEEIIKIISSPSPKKQNEPDLNKNNSSIFCKLISDSSSALLYCDPYSLYKSCTEAIFELKREKSDMTWEEKHLHNKDNNEKKIIDR